MDNLTKVCNERDLDGVIKYFYSNRFPKNDFVLGSTILEDVIINQDVEILEVLLRNKIVFNEDVLNALPYTSEEIFLLVYNYIIHNHEYLDINFKQKPDFLIDICKSYSSTEKMFLMALNSKCFDVNYKDYSGKKIIHLIVCFGKRGFIKHLKGFDINYLEKDDDGYTIFDYAMKKSYESIIYDLLTFKPILKTLFARQYSNIASHMLYK